MLPPCLGRRDLQTRVRSGLIDRRWVTLVGPPGVGKSLLARHAATAARVQVWIDVGAISSIEDLIGAWLQALEADIAPGDTAILALVHALDDHERLTILDGVDEGLLAGVGELITGILDATRVARFLVTSLVPVGAPAELDLRVDPLPVPLPHQPLEGAALELFVSRLAGAGGDLVDLDRDGTQLRSLLVASGGIPLVLEQMASQAAQVGLDRVVPPDSLAGAIGASYALLDEGTRTAHRRLGTLDFPVGIDVLAQIMGMPRALAIGVAAQLERQSLVLIGADGRLRMLAPVRRHALALATDEDGRATRVALVRWADGALPATEEDASATSPWLADFEAAVAAVQVAADDPTTRDLAYDLANRAFGTLYSAMRPRDALTLYELALASGDGPPEIGAQSARRAGICASEVHGTFAGMSFLDRAEEHAAACHDATFQRARTASIRAEMYLDAGQLTDARSEVERILALGVTDTYAIRQARRTLMDIEVSSGNLDLAEDLAPLLIDGAEGEERWLAIAAQILCAQIAWERGRELEAFATAKAAREEATELGEDRIGLLADIIARRVSGRPAQMTPDPEELPWAVRLGYQLQGAREAAAAGEFAKAAGLAADVVVLADSSRLARDGVEARIVLADALLAQRDYAQALGSYAAAARRAAAAPLPLRVAEAFDGLALTLRQARPEHAGRCAWVAATLRAARGAVAHPRPGLDLSLLPPVLPVRSWVVNDQLSPEGADAAGRLEDTADRRSAPSPVAQLTKAQRAVAELVGAGLTSKEIAERLYLSPRTVDNHLAQIYRRLDIPSRSKLAALMADEA